MNPCFIKPVDDLEKVSDRAAEAIQPQAPRRLLTPLWEVDSQPKHKRSCVLLALLPKSRIAITNAFAYSHRISRRMRCSAMPVKTDPGLTSRAIGALCDFEKKLPCRHRRLHRAKTLSKLLDCQNICPRDDVGCDLKYFGFHQALKLRVRRPRPAQSRKDEAQLREGGGVLERGVGFCLRIRKDGSRRLKIGQRCEDDPALLI